jgi:hypothetical protein
MDKLFGQQDDGNKGEQMKPSLSGRFSTMSSLMESTVYFSISALICAANEPTVVSSKVAITNLR